MARRVPITPRDVQMGLHRVTEGLRHHAAALPQMIKVDISKVPDWQRRAYRLSIAVMFFGFIGHCVQFSAEHQSFASNFRQSCNWAAITCIVVTAPLIGKVAQVAFDRLLGTAVGGAIGCVCFIIGFHLFGAFGGGIFISLMSGVTIWATTYLAFRHALDQLARFMQLTYIIVAFGAKPDKGALLLGLMRIGGIFAGGLLSVLLAVVVLPRSASVESLREMKKALKALHDLNQEVWALSGATGSPPANNRRGIRKQHRHGYSAMQLRMDSVCTRGPSPFMSTSGAAGAGTAGPGAGGANDSAAAGGQGDPLGRGSMLAGRSLGSYSVLPSSGSGEFRRNGADSSSAQLNLLVQRDAERDSHEARVEKLFTSVYTALARADENLAASKGEIYVYHFWGRYFFLPGVHWFPVRGRWHVPRKDLEDLATCLRRVARMLWTLLLDFEEGFGSEMEDVLQLYYPKQLLSELGAYQSRAIQDLLQAFPNSTSIEVDNLFTLGQLTDCLMQISDARARNAFFNVKRKRTPRRSAGAALPVGTAAAVAAGRVSTPGISTRGSSASAAGAGAVSGGAGADETEMELARGDGWRTRTTGGDAATTASAAADKEAADATGAAESAPLLSKQQHTSSSWAGTPPQPTLQQLQLQSLQPGRPSSNGLPPVGSSGRLGPSSNGLLRAGSSGGGGSPGASAGGSGVFISRLLSGQRGSPMALHTTPRRYLQEQQELLLTLRRSQEQEASIQQQQPAQQRAEGEVVKGRVSNAGVPVAVSAAAPAQLLAAPSAPEAAAASASGGPPARRSESIDILGNLTFGQLTLALASSDSGRQERQQQLQQQAVASDQAQGPLVPTAAKAAVASGTDAAGTGGGVTDGAPPDTPCGTPRVSPFSSFANLQGANAAAGGSDAYDITTNATNSSTATPRINVHADAGAGAHAAAAAATTAAAAGAAPLSTTAPAAAAAAAGTSDGGGGDGSTSPGAMGGGVPEGGLVSAGLSSMLSGRLTVEAVTFPPTEEGYLSQVRWYSFQFVMDEMVNELEEAFHACSAVLQQLPYPIGN